MSSAGGVQRPEYADFRYQEAVGHLKQLLADGGGGSCSGRGSDAGSVRSRARSSSRALDPAAARPELSSFRSEVGSYRRHVSSSRLLTSSYRADTAGYRPEMASFKPDISSYRPDISSYRPDVATIRPQSAMEVGCSRRFEPLLMGSGSVRAVSPVSVRSLRLTADDPLPLTDDVTGPDAVDSTGGRHPRITDNGNTGSQQIQVLELRQLTLRQEALTQQLEQENSELREAADELRSYVQQLVAENDSLAEDLRTREANSVPSEAVEAAEARLTEAREELGRLRRQMTVQEQRLKEGHAEQLRTAVAEKDKLTGSVEQLKVDLEEQRRQAGKAEQKAAASLRQAEQAQSAHTQADATAARLRRDLEERDRRADRAQMEHERRLVAAREQAEQAVRDTFDKLQQQLDRQQRQLSELEGDKERHQRQEQELKSALELQRQAAAQTKFDADSAAQRHQRELESLQKRIQPPAPVSAGQERLRREVATLRQQLTAAENQLTIANRERGRLQQQMWRLDRRPAAAAADRDGLAGVLGDDGMAVLPRQLNKVFGRTSGNGSPQLHQPPMSYRQVKDSDSARAASPAVSYEASSGASSLSLPPSRGSPAISRKLSQPILSRASPPAGRKLSQGSVQSARGSPSFLRRSPLHGEAGSTETVTEIIEIISPGGEYIQRTETEHQVPLAPEERPPPAEQPQPQPAEQPQPEETTGQQGDGRPVRQTDETTAENRQTQPQDKKEKQQKNQEQQQELQKEMKRQEPEEQKQVAAIKDEKNQPQTQPAQQKEQPSQPQQQSKSTEEQPTDGPKATPKSQEKPAKLDTAEKGKTATDGSSKEATSQSAKSPTTKQTPTPK